MSDDTIGFVLGVALALAIIAIAVRLWDGEWPWE